MAKWFHILPHSCAVILVHGIVRCRDPDETDGHPEKTKMIKSKSRTRPDGRYVYTYLNV